MSQVETLFDYSLPKDPNERQKFKTKMNEVVKCLTVVQSQNETVKEILADMKEEYEIPVDFLRNIANAQVKENFGKGRQKAEAKYDLVDEYNSIINKQS